MLLTRPSDENSFRTGHGFGELQNSISHQIDSIWWIDDDVKTPRQYNNNRMRDAVGVAAATVHNPKHKHLFKSESQFGWILHSLQRPWDECDQRKSSCRLVAARDGVVDIVLGYHSNTYTVTHERICKDVRIDAPDPRILSPCDGWLVANYIYPCQGYIWICTNTRICTSSINIHVYTLYICRLSSV